MPSKLIALISADELNCNLTGDQYIVESYVAKCADLDLDAAIFDNNGEIADIPWLTQTTPWVLLNPIDDSTSYYKQTYNPDRNLIVQDSFFKVAGISTTKILAMDVFKDACCLVLLHRLNDNTALLQGVNKIFYDAEWYLVPTRLNAKKNSGIISTGSENETATIGISFSSVSTNYSLMVTSVADLTGIPDTEEPEGNPPTADIDVIQGVVQTPISNAGGCGQVTTLVAAYVNTDPGNVVNIDTFPYSLPERFCNTSASPQATHIEVSATAFTVCGQNTIYFNVPISVVNGKIAVVGGVSCGLVPSVTFSLSGATLAKTVSDGCNCGMATESYTVAVGGTNVNLPSNSFPVDLKPLLCGLTVGSVSNVVLTANIQNSQGKTSQSTFNIPISRQSGKISAVNGVACNLVVAPTVQVNLVGLNLYVTWNKGGDNAATKELFIEVPGAAPIVLTSISDSDTFDLSQTSLAWLYLAGAASTVTAIARARITNSVSAVDSTENIYLTVTEPYFGSRVSVINNEPLYSGAPSIAAPVLSGNNIVAEPVVTLNGWHPATLRTWIDKNVGGTIDFTIGGGLTVNLTTLVCNSSLGSGTTLTLKSAVESEVYGALESSAVNLPITRNGSNVITSVNGVACSLATPEVNLTIVNNIITAATFDLGGAPSGDLQIYSADVSPLVYFYDGVSSGFSAPLDLKTMLCGLYAVSDNIQIGAFLSNGAAADTKQYYVAVTRDPYNDTIRSVGGVSCFTAPSINFQIAFTSIFNKSWNAGGDPNATILIECIAKNITFGDVSIFDETTPASIFSASNQDISVMMCGKEVYPGTTQVDVVMSITNGHSTVSVTRTVDVTIDGGNLINSINGVDC